MLFRFYVFMLFLGCVCSGYTQEKYSIVVDPSTGPKVAYGVTILEGALKEKGVRLERVANIEKASGKQIIVAGLQTKQGNPVSLVQNANRTIPAVSEAFVIGKGNYNGKPVLALEGYDEQGLMYALLEAAMRTRWGSKRAPFEFIGEMTEKPELANRAISIYTMNRAWWEHKLFDTKYWVKYFDMLSQNRFNSFVIIFGYENGGFMAPPYPYFFDVPGFPGVRMVGLTKEEQQRNLAALNEVITMAHQRGIKVTLGIWDHIYRGGVQASGIPGWERTLNEPTEGLVWGVTADNLIPYTKAALSLFIKYFPTIDGIEFRMHNESGVSNSEQVDFWKDVFKSLKVDAPDMNFVLRAKEMSESVVQAALDENIQFQIETKYWMEQMGMPWHPVQINKQNQMERRHGYADMLRYPQDYKVYWRLWTGGTTRILLWGSPDYARRFIESAKLYDGDTYEVNEPLATKMETLSHDAEIIELLNPKYRYYDYEFERYWHYFQVFGRMGYNLEQSPDVWQKEFELRFGKAAPYLEQAIHQASWILPRIIASCYPYSAFPTTRGWAEKQALGWLPVYAANEGSDVRLFANFDEEAQLLIERGETPKLLPSINSFWFKQRSEDMNELIHQAEKNVGRNRSKEFTSTITDLKILSNLALYHARRIPAAVSYRLFVRTNDPAALDRAIAYEQEAINAWKQLVEAAGDVYTTTLDFGVNGVNNGGVMQDLRGHWTDELAFLEADLEALVKQRTDFKPAEPSSKAPEYKAAVRADNSALFDINLDVIETAPVHKALTVRAQVTGVNGIKQVRLRHRPMNQKFEYETLHMTLTAEKDVYEATIPVQDINPRFDHMYFIEVMDNEGNGMTYPDWNIQTPYIVVKLER